MERPENKRGVPSVFTCVDGTEVKTKEEWFLKRRPELLELFRREEYGRLPDMKDVELHFRVADVREGDDIMAGGAERKTVEVEAVRNKGYRILASPDVMTKEELENKIATFTGGRAAEELIFHSITTGASNDIEQATKIARAMISRYGMSDDFDMVAMETVSNQYLGGDSSLACSFETQTLLDKKVVDLVRTQHEKALKILQDNIGKLHELAKYLYEHETITGEEFMKILEAPSEIPGVSLTKE